MARRLALRIAFALIASFGVAALVSCFIATRDFRPMSYFMPGDLGSERISDVSVSDYQHFSVSPDAFLTRSIGLRAGVEEQWGRRNGVTPRLEFSHNLANVFPPELAKTHPEYFPLTGSKRLMPPPNSGFWNPDLGREDVARYAADQATTYFRTHSDGVTFSLGVNDGLMFGESPETMALITPLRWFRERPDFSPLVFTFMNRAAAESAKSYPDKYLGCLAYYWCENAPPFAVDSHVIPFFTADRSQSYDREFLVEEFDLQTRWAKAIEAGTPPKTEKLKIDGVRSASAGVSTFSMSASQRFTISQSDRGIRPRLGLYDYLNGQGFLVPRVPIHAFAEHIKHAHRVGFTDYYGESSRNWGLDGPMPWVIAQLLQDPEQNVDALLDLYYENYFQAAAGPMRRFFARCEIQWMRQAGPSYWLKHYRNQSQTILFPPAVCAELRGLLNEAAKLANNDRVRQRVAFVSDAFGVTERFVAFQEARDALARAVLKADFTGHRRGSREFHAESGSPRAQRPPVNADLLLRLLNDYSVKKNEFIRYAHETTERWPLAFYPINYDDFLRDDPAFAAAVRLQTNVQHSTFNIQHRTQAIADSGSAAEAARTGRLRELGINGRLEGAVVPGRRVAGLQYGIDLPAPWSSQVEPTERGEAALEKLTSGKAETLKSEQDLSDSGKFQHVSIGELSREALGTTSQHSLRISGAENTTVYQWQPVKAGKLYIASVLTRGTVTNSDMVTLTLGWLNAKMKHIGTVVVMRLPDGSWPDWVQLQQGARAPADAAYVGIGIRIMHQVAPDWAEFSDFRLLEAE